MQSALGLMVCGAMLLAPLATIAQVGSIARTLSKTTAELDGALPDAPVPQFSIAEPSPEVLRGDDFGIGAESSSSLQQPTAQQPAGDDARKKAQQQIKEEEHQRVLGILPAVVAAIVEGRQGAELTMVRLFDVGGIAGWDEQQRLAVGG